MFARQLYKTLSLLAFLLLLALLLVGTVVRTMAQAPQVQTGEDTTPRPDPKATANVFTPNGDGINDRFIPRKDLQGYTLQVFDRWGNLVHSGTQDTPWDGNGPGGAHSEGVYVFRLRGLLASGDSLNYVGTVLLLR
ncbi:MAG: gliding motility-associated C-terminal domain-containing protein [Bacteroidetes bacterium]|nr:gliding motility-associated C-terminal domain-containing protein [Bacteroidota bacterium]